ncbi:hypothetical protein PEBR_42865 [Penicillium brasilianum]|uniref:Xylanolytic transcriptional activator regulatory domain-containing protein n=1 Tax=Penicillium brasilianum TaxID=104259 RepID=A0A1S9R8K0_PENBI|nr:hypothetical protein PEBR_42865 [Penicillium brasilianum]
MGVECVRSSTRTKHTSILQDAIPSPAGRTSIEKLSLLHISADQSPGLKDATPLGHLPTGGELEELIHLYFASVHHFGFVAFIHQLHFNRLLAEGKAPRELTLMMIASATRFARDPSPENLAKADAWADAALEALLPRIYQGFGAVQLMTILLAQHYELNRGNFTSAWLLSANCTRMMQMMSLHTFDRTYPAKFPSHLQLSPLLSREALRRLAWSTFFFDSMIDGGRYGFHSVDEHSYRLQLPCDQASFLGNENVVTETLFPESIANVRASIGNAQQAPLDIWAYVLRIAAARRRALHFAFRASHRERTVEEMTAELAIIEADVESVVSDLPKRFHFSTDNVFIHRDRLPTFLLLHVMRHNLFIILGRAALLVYQRDSTKADLVAHVRRKRISHALPIASILAEGLKARVVLDPHLGIQAYVALEILLFEPRRLAEIDPYVDPKAPDFMVAIPDLLTVIRDLGHRSEGVRQLHVEAVHRLLRFNCGQILNQVDIEAFQSGYRLVGQDLAEFDFRDFRWAKVERIRRGAPSAATGGGDEVLLEYRVDGDTAAHTVAPSPRLDAIDVNSALGWSPLVQSAPSAVSHTMGLSEGPRLDDHGLESTRSEYGLLDEPSLDWPWLLEESGLSVYQTGDPETFWSQLERI